MTICVVTYDLHQERNRDDDRALLREELKSLGDWARLSESSYALDTSLNVKGVYNHLIQFLDANDQLYVITLTAPHIGYGPPDVNEWLNKRLGPPA